MRRANRRDKSEALIVASLRAAGAFVYQSLPTDLLVRYRGVWHVLECKSEVDTSHHAKPRKSQAAQTEFLTLHDIKPVKTPTDALVQIGACQLPGERKDRQPAEYMR